MSESLVITFIVLGALAVLALELAGRSGRIRYSFTLLIEVALLLGGLSLFSLYLDPSTPPLESLGRGFGFALAALLLYFGAMFGTMMLGGVTPREWLRRQDAAAVARAQARMPRADDGTGGRSSDA